MVEGFVLVAGVEYDEALASDADAAFNHSQDINEKTFSLQLFYLGLLSLLFRRLKLGLSSAEYLGLELIQP